MHLQNIIVCILFKYFYVLHASTKFDSAIIILLPSSAQAQAQDRQAPRQPDYGFYWEEALNKKMAFHDSSECQN